MTTRKRHSKRNRRILILVCLFVLMGAAGFGAYRWRQAARDDDARASRDEGIAALEKQEYAAAMGGLAPFLRRLGETEGTSEDFRMYAEARQHVPEPNNQHLRDSIAYFERAVLMDSGNRRAQAQLLDLYQLVGYWDEARQLIDRMLSVTPADADLIARRAQIATAKGDLQAAHRDAQALVAAAPDDVAAHLLNLRLRIKLGQDDREVEEWLEQAVADHPDTLGFRILQAFGLLQLSSRERGDPALRDRAEDIVIKVSRRAESLEDRASIGLLVFLLDSFGRYDASIEVLRKAIRLEDTALQTAYVRGLWYRRRGADIPDAVASWIAGGATVAAETRALAAAVLAARSDTEAAKALAAPLLSSEEAGARAWGAALAYVNGFAASERETATDALAALRIAAPGSAIAAHAYGTLHAAGDPDLARVHWLAAAKLAPAWSEPLRRAAESLLGTAQRPLALEYGSEAFRRAPGDAATVATYADCVVANVEHLSARQRRRFLAVVGRARKSASARVAAHFGALEATLLSRVGDDATDERFEELLQEADEATEIALLRLARAASAVGSPLAEKFLSACEATHGVTPSLTLTRAALLARTATHDAAIERFDRDRSRAGAEAGSGSYAWDTARAALLDRFSNSEAGPAWIAIANAYSTRLEAQKACLSSAAAWSDRAAIDVVIERAKALSGAGAVAWRIARGRWLATAPEASQEELARAILLLNEVTDLVPRSLEARMQLGGALERIGGQFDSALQEYRTALELAPGNIGIELTICRLQAQQGDFVGARARLERVLSADRIATEHLVVAAMLLVSQGDFEMGRQVLDERLSLADAPRAGVRRLAVLYARLGEPERALELCDRVLETPDLETLALAARLNADLGRREVAVALIDRMSTVGAEPLDVALARARFAGSYLSAATTAEAYRAAIAVKPGSELAWLELARFEISRGEAQEVATILDDPRSENIEALRDLRAHRELVIHAVNAPWLRSVLLECLQLQVESGEKRDVLMGVLQDLDDVVSARSSLERLAERTEATVRAHPELLSPRLLVVEIWDRARDLPRSVAAARRAMESHPTAVAPASLLTAKLEKAGRWRDVAAAATAWRQRLQGIDLDVDARLGRALLETGRERDALSLFEARADLARSQPEVSRSFIVGYAVALVHSGDVSGAATLIRDVIERDPSLRDALYAVSCPRLGTGEAAREWLELLEGVAAPRSFEDGELLARGWASAWQAYPSNALRGIATARLDALVNDESATADLLYRAAFFAELSERNDDAEALYRRGLELDNKNLSCRNNLAMLLVRTGRGEEAVSEALRAVELAPESPELLDTLGIAYRSVERWEDAKDAFEEALSGSPTATSSRLNLAEMLFKLGRWRALKRVVSDIGRAEMMRRTLDDDERGRYRVLQDAVR